MKALGVAVPEGKFWEFGRKQERHDGAESPQAFAEGGLVVRVEGAPSRHDEGEDRDAEGNEEKHVARNVARGAERDAEVDVAMGAATDEVVADD